MIPYQAKAFIRIYLGILLSNYSNFNDLSLLEFYLFYLRKKFRDDFLND